MVLENIDLQVERYVINKFISMPKLFDDLNIEYSLTGNMYCPFHHNVNTKAAKLYHDEIGWRLWCFSEQRMFGAYNIYKEFKPNLDTHRLAIMILQRLPEKEREQIIKESGQEVEADVLPFNKALEEFREHSINYDELLNSIVDKLEEGEDN